MAAIESFRPSVHRKIHLNSCSGIHLCRGFSLFRCQSRFFSPTSKRGLVNCSTSASREVLALNCSKRVNVWGGCISKKGLRDSRILANSTEGGDSTASSGEKSEAKASDSQGVNVKQSSQGPPDRRKEKHGKKRWWWQRGGKWQWQPIIQAQEIGILLLQLGIVMFVMRLLRPGIPLPGSDPKTPVAYISVPYSDFLSKINSNQVKKVEVDGVHIMFKLKPESGYVGNGVGTSSALQESESSLRTVSPTKRVIYTTTRPTDIKTPYEKMLDNQVEFGSPDKRSGGFFNSALVSSLWFTMKWLMSLNRYWRYLGQACFKNQGVSLHLIAC